MTRTAVLKALLKEHGAMLATLTVEEIFQRFDVTAREAGWLWTTARAQTRQTMA